MNRDDLISLLRMQSERARTPSPVCPPEDEIAAYVEGTLDRSSHESMERHLTDCCRCIALVGLLSRDRDATIEERVAPDLLAKVASIEASQRARPTSHYFKHWAMAATLVLIVPLLVFLGRPGGTPQSTMQPPTFTLRSAQTPASSQDALRLFVPVPGSAIDGHDLDFRWNAVPGSPYYDVRIVTDDGTLVADQRIDGTEWRPPSLPSGQYYVRVDAYPAGDKALSSEHVPFRVVN